MNLALRAVLMLLVTAPLFVASGFHVPPWQIFVAAAVGSAMGQVAVRVTRSRPRAKPWLFVATTLVLVGTIALVLRASSRGSTRRIVVVTNVADAGRTSLTLDDAQALAALPEVAAIAPVATNRATTLTVDDSNWSVEVLGTTPAYLAVRGRSLARGTSFSDTELEAAAKVVVLGPTTARQLFGSGDAVGQEVRIANRAHRIVGVLAPSTEHEDDVAILPLTTFRRSLGFDAGHVFRGRFFVLPRAGATTEPMRALLRDRHRLAPGDADDFVVHDAMWPSAS